jgi:glucose-6-phosphate 1-dehydrogenase
VSDTAPPCTIVIFGAVGDLTQRLLMPSIYNLAAAGLLDPQTRILGADHNDRTADSWRKEMGDAVHRSVAAAEGKSPPDVPEPPWSFVADRLDYLRLDFTKNADYETLAQHLNGTANALFYLAVSPRFFEPICAGIAGAGLLVEKETAFRRIIVEKPFGRDLKSAQKLNARLMSLAAEPQLYFIDHFLGKEAVQGIPALRFANAMIEPLLNRDAVASVQITAAETVGVEERGAFYETTGALRDMIPNHLFSLLTLVAMDQPRAYDAQAVRDAKVALLYALRPLAPADGARGQYAGGLIDGKSVRAYRDEDNVARDSRTETYAALSVHVDNDRWRDVPFYLRTGKRMGAHVTTIAMTLRTPSGPLDAHPTTPHLLLFGIDPQRGLIQRFAAKRPGVELRLGRATTGFRYDTTFDEPPNFGYETLLYHTMCGQALSFQRVDMIEREWAVVENVLDAWSNDAQPPEGYVSGGAGPSCADTLLARNGDRWLKVAPLETLDVAEVASDP